MKLAYKVIISLAILVLFLSGTFLLGAKIYDKPPASSVYNEDYNGFSRVYRILDEKGYSMKVEAVDAGNVSYLGSGALWVIFSPVDKYSDKEKGKLKDFVARGGKLLIADRFDSGRELAGTFGIVVFNHELVDYASFNKRQDLPVLPAALDGKTTYSLVYKFPSAIENYPKETEILSKSSRISFIDADGNGKITIKDHGGPFPVAVKVKYEKGEVVFFSDPNVFSNDLIGRRDNSEFARDLIFSMHPQLIVFDESHGKGALLTQNSKLFVFVSDSIKNYKPVLAIILLVIVFFILWKVFVLPKKKKKETKLNSMPTEYSLTAQKIMVNSGNSVYVRRWIVLTGYNKIRKNILAKMRSADGKNITKEGLLINSGLSGKEKDNLASVIDIGMSLERGENIDISYGRMQGLIADIERLNDFLK